MLYKNTSNIINHSLSLKKVFQPPLQCDKDVKYERFDNHLAKYLTIALLNN